MATAASPAGLAPLSAGVCRAPACGCCWGFFLRLFRFRLDFLSSEPGSDSVSEAESESESESRGAAPWGSRSASAIATEAGAVEVLAEDPRLA